MLGRKLYRCFSCVCCLGVDGADDPFYDHPQLVREVDAFGTVHLYLNTKKGTVIQRYRNQVWPVVFEPAAGKDEERPGGVTHFESCIDPFEEDTVVDSDVERVMASKSGCSKSDSGEEEMEWGIQEYFEEIKSPSSGSSGESPTAQCPSLNSSYGEEDQGYPWIKPSVEVSSFDELVPEGSRQREEIRRQVVLRILAYTASAYWCRRQQRIVGRLDRRHEKLAGWCEMHRFLVKFNLLHVMAQFMSQLGQLGLDRNGKC